MCSQGVMFRKNRGGIFLDGTLGPKVMPECTQEFVTKTQKIRRVRRRSVDNRWENAGF
jgi:hypothetical protein